jgi:GNAT superfamily N-acetyltransferase
MTQNSSAIIYKVKDKTEDYLEGFYKEIWKNANIEYYGKQIDWSTTTRIIEAHDGDALVGVLELRVQVGVAYVFEVAVAFPHQSKGIGKVLMEKAEEIAREMKCHKIYLETGKTWGKTTFYEKLGYEQTGVFPKHFGGHDYIQYSKFLS